LLTNSAAGKSKWYVKDNTLINWKLVSQADLCDQRKQGDAKSLTRTIKRRRVETRKDRTKRRVRWAEAHIPTVRSVIRS